VEEVPEEASLESEAAVAAVAVVDAEVKVRPAALPWNI